MDDFHAQHEQCSNMTCEHVYFQRGGPGYQVYVSHRLSVTHPHTAGPGAAETGIQRGR